jgi:hypothetical protein
LLTSTNTRAVGAKSWTARVLLEIVMAESERARELKQYAERLEELRRYL